MKMPNLTPKQLERFWAKVEKTETCWNWNGGKTPGGYGKVTASSNGMAGQFYVHRLSYFLARGEDPEGRDIDHMCHNRSCVNPEHLRPVTTKQNMENRSGAPRTNTSGHLGVTWHKQAKKWQARVFHGGESFSAGLHATSEEAGEAARAKRLELFSHNDMDRQVAA